MVQCVTSVLLIYLLIIKGASAVRNCNSSWENWQSRIGILISPMISGSRIREIEVYWHNLNIEQGDQIFLYEEDVSGSPRPIYTVTPNGTSGVQNTGVQIDFVPSSNLSFVQEYLKYGVGWKNENKIKRLERLKMQPRWMEERRNILGPLRMSQIFLPGTHDSASYDENGGKTNIISDYAVTQDLDILGQLIHGVRYLDIRVGHYPVSDEKYWTNHGPFYRSVPLKTVLDQVKIFLNNTKEILIMDIREFPIGFHNISDHHALASYLEDELRDYYRINDAGWKTTLNDIWSSERRLIIGYENTQIVRSHAGMWPCVFHQWGNVNNVQALYKYLRKVEMSDSVNRLRPRSAMAQLTASVFDILFNGLGSLRNMAYKVNLNVTIWYSTIWQYTANIVAVDFVRSTDIVEIAITSNENRHLYCRH